MTYGSAPANYSVPGEAGGLARIDKILGLSLYSSSFGASPLVFGAFPSLHSASATIEMLFVYYLQPRLWPLCIAYTMWLWWSTMYLTHHYLIDLVGGSIYAFCAYFIARYYLPSVDPKARTRLDYLGIKKFGLGALLRSIERHRPDNNQEDEEAALLTEKENDEDIEKWSIVSPVSLTSGDSSPSEPCSPISPRSSFHVPAKD